METLEIDVEELKKLNEDNLVMMLPPGRMGGDSYIIIYKKGNKYYEYYIDYCDEINEIFPKRKVARDNPKYYEKLYYKDDNYFVIDMGMGCCIFIKNEYAMNYIYNIKSLLDERFNLDHSIEEVLCLETYLCGCWREAALKTFI